MRAHIRFFARGVPYVVQLLGLHAGDRAVSRGADVVDEADLEAAIRRTLDEIDPRVVLLYEDLAHVGRETAMQNVLWMIASGDASAGFRSSSHMATFELLATRWAWRNGPG